MWDGRSKGTLNNILNLLQQQKKVLVYFSPDKSCYTLSSLEDLTALLHKCSSDVRRKFERDWLFRPLDLACVHAVFSFVPHESACNSRASESIKRR
jgi:hypothetical protein